MAPPLCALIDLDVILDVLQERQPFYTASAAVLAAAEIGRIEGWVAAHSVTTLHYLLSRHVGATKARGAIGDLLGVLEVAAVDGTVIRQALALPVVDFEDAVQVAAALAVGARCVVTRNLADYRSSPLPAYAPAEVLPLIPGDDRSRAPDA